MGAAVAVTNGDGSLGMFATTRSAMLQSGVMTPAKGLSSNRPPEATTAAKPRFQPPAQRPRSAPPPLMSKFFIRRPIVAIVIAIVMTIVGAVAMIQLPISQYPNIVPPEIQVRANYTGADAQTIEQSVATPIEQQMSGVDQEQLHPIGQRQRLHPDDRSISTSRPTRTSITSSPRCE